MATVRLEGWGGEGYESPPLCMKCGAPATVYKERLFSWHPPWVYALLPLGVLFPLIAWTLTQQKRIEVPLCDAHAGHWWKRTTLILVGLLLVLGLLVAAVSQVGPGGDDALAAVFLILAGLGFLAWIILAVYLTETMIRPTEIKPGSITLKGVAQEFADAVEEEEEERDRRRWELDHYARDDRDHDRHRGPHRSDRVREARAEDWPDASDEDYRRGRR
jgi:hypothetical protein